MATIERQDPVQLSQSWGASFSDYKVRIIYDNYFHNSFGYLLFR